MANRDSQQKNENEFTSLNKLFAAIRKRLGIIVYIFTLFYIQREQIIAFVVKAFFINYPI